LAGVTTTTTNTETYERLDTEFDSVSPAVGAAEKRSARIPNIFWAGVVLFAVNMLILFCIWLSPELRVNMYGEDGESSNAYFRPSPFTEMVQLAKVQKPRQAAKVRPVFYEEPLPTEFSQSADLLLPRSTQSTATSLTASRPEQPVSGSEVDRVVDSYSAFPRVTASLNTVHTGSVEVAPRRVSERPATHVIIDR
jgi:hypothetical protein